MPCISTNTPPMVAEDDVDIGSLQAQIDMSMSFAHNLVTSWIKPTQLTHLSFSGVNASQVLEEELRRPPRLGVGTPIPTATHEASKLKRRLGKYGTKHEGVTESQPRDSLKSDDEEHKGRQSKRKLRVDPFGHEGNKKKKKVDSEADPYRPAKDVAGRAVFLPKNSSVGKLQNHNSSSGMERQRTGQSNQQSYATERQQSATLAPSSSVGLPVQTILPPSLTAPTPPSSSESSRETSAPVPEKVTTTGSTQVRATSMPTYDKAESLGIPLLNLDGPPELADKPGSTSELNNSKRKRKRRKKKKTKMNVGTGDNSH